MVRDNLNGFINWNVGEQGSNVKAGHEYVISIDFTVQKFLNKREGIFDDKGVHGDRREERDEEFGNLVGVVINTG